MADWLNAFTFLLSLTLASGSESKKGGVNQSCWQTSVNHSVSLQFGLCNPGVRDEVSGVSNDLTSSFLNNIKQLRIPGVPEM